MIRIGDRLENPVTGEVMIFHGTSHETGGELVQVETIVRPGGFVAAAHVHPYRAERLEVLEGELGPRVGGWGLVAGPGDVVTVQPGTPHRFWNAGEAEAHFLCAVRPALGFESLIETMFTARHGEQDESQRDTEPAAADGDRTIALRHRAPAVPAGMVQRAALAMGGMLGRLLGYRPTARLRCKRDAQDVLRRAFEVRCSNGGSAWEVRVRARVSARWL